VVILLAFSAPLAAQQECACEASRLAATSFGFEMPVRGGLEPSHRVLVVRHTSLEDRDAGLELTLGLSAVNGYAMLMPEAGPAWSIGGPRSTLLLRAGISTIWVVLPGVYVGAGLMLNLGDRVATRLDVTRRVFMVEDRRFGMWTVGASVAFVSERR
jgi:hypothetical protein